MKRGFVGFVMAAMAACGGTGNGGDDAGMTAGPDAGRASGGSGGSGSGSGLKSTLTASCATLQGRAIVNDNGNLGIAFTDDVSTFIGSLQFQLPDGFAGPIPDPESWDGQSDRKVVAVTSPSYELHGNHCWPTGDAPTGGSVVIETWKPDRGIVKATFTALALHSCTGGEVCTVDGTLETTGTGVFD